MARWRFIWATILVVSVLLCSRATAVNKRPKATRKKHTSKASKTSTEVHACEADGKLTFSSAPGGDRAFVDYANVPSLAGGNDVTSTLFSVAFKRLEMLSMRFRQEQGPPSQSLEAELQDTEGAFRRLAAPAPHRQSAAPGHAEIGKSRHKGPSLDTAGEGELDVEEVGARVGDDGQPTTCAHAPSCAVLGLILDARREMHEARVAACAGGEAVGAGEAPADAGTCGALGGFLRDEAALGAEAARWTVLGAEGGDASAMANLATLIEAGRGPDSHVRQEGRLCRCSSSYSCITFVQCRG